MKDTFGFEIIGYNEAKTPEEKIHALTEHKYLLQGLVSEAISSLNQQIEQWKQK